MCKHNFLTTKAPWAAAQWDHEANNGTPETVIARSCRTAHWLCDVYNHKCSATPNQRVGQNTGCPQCARFKKWTRHPTFADQPLLAEWDHRRNDANGHFPADRSSGSAATAQQDSCAVGLQCLLKGPAASSMAVQCVLGRWHADAILCRHSTLT